MSVLMGKRLLVIVEKGEQLPEVVNQLEELGVLVHLLSCVEVNQKKVTELQIDFIIGRHSATMNNCINHASILFNKFCPDVVPVFAVVENNERDIQDALHHGAIDYLTIGEDIESVEMKINTAVAKDSVFSNTVIDVTPPIANMTSSGLKVFVIEDDPLLRNLLSMQMDKSSYVYEFCSDGDDVVSALKQFKPHAIILDLMLPGKSGLEVLADIKKETILSKIPVVVFSNRDGRVEREKSKELGAAGFYVKAMTDLSELLVTIKTLTDK